jgi:hypothetical protein
MYENQGFTPLGAGCGLLRVSSLHGVFSRTSDSFSFYNNISVSACMYKMGA